MSQKTVIYFSIWTSAWAAVFYHFYMTFVASFGVPWVMFVCMAIFFGMDLASKQFYCAILSAFRGMAWGQVDFLLIGLLSRLGLGSAAASFLSIVLGTFAAMYIHLKLLSKTPLGLMPFVFAGVCLTFSQNGGNVVGLGSTFVIGILLSALCCGGLHVCQKRYPVREKEEA